MTKISLLSALIASAISTGAQAANWTDFHSLDVPQGLPSTVQDTQSSADSQVYQVSGLHLNLGEVLQNETYRLQDPQTVVIVADTLEISQDLLQNLNNQTLFIFARHITGSASATFNIDATQTANNATVAVFVDEIDTSFRVNTILPGFQFETQTIAASPDALGQFIAASNGNYNSTPITDALTSLLSIQQQNYLDVFNHSFDMAASVYDQAPQTSLAMLTWVERVLRAAPALRNQDAFTENLYLQVANLKQFIQFATQNDNYVPGLDRSLYESTYVAYLDAMEAYQDRYDLFMQQGRDLADRATDAGLMLANLEDAVSAESQIIARSVTQVGSLESSLDTQRSDFNAQSFNVTVAERDFQQGVLDYKQQQRIKIAIEVVETIASAGTAIAGTAGGDPSGLIEFATSIPETTQELISLAEQIEAIGQLLSDVREASAGISALSADSSVSVSDDELANNFAQLNVTVPTLEQVNLAWEAFIINARAQMQGAIDEDIGGASDYLVALEKLVSQGKAISATEVALAQELSRQIDLRISAEVNRAQVARINNLIGEIETQQSALATLETEFFRALNSLKRPMFVALANYEAAFNYWALEDSNVEPSLNRSYEEYRRDIAFLREQEAATLDRFNPRPQNFMLAVMDINHPQQLKDFAGDGELAFSIRLDNLDFDEFDRIRLDEVNVILKGAGLQEGQRYSIDVRTTGEYQDRLGTRDFSFNAEPLFRRISYTLVDAQTSEVDVITNGAIASDYAINYFEPTPFSTWSIRLRNPESFDLSQVESIQVEFKGNAIPRID